MATPPGDVAKALLDSLPTLDHKKLLEEARRTFGIVIVGDEQSGDALLRLLRAQERVPDDAKVALWRHTPGANPPVPLGKTELAIVIPATEEYLKQARESFGGVPILPVALGDAAVPAEASTAVYLAALDRQHVRREVVPLLVERLWERRLALGRAVPATRDRIAWQLIVRAVRDVKVLLGSVAGAARGRSGVPTAATAQVLVHQAGLIVAIGAVYGAEIEDKGALIRRVTPKLTPSLMLDLAEARLSDLVESIAGDKNKHKSLYGTAAAVIARPTLTASSTLLVGLAARRVFRASTVEEPSSLARAVAQARTIGKRTVVGVGHGAVALVGLAAARRRREEPAPAAEGAPATGDGDASFDAEAAPEDRAS